MPITLDEITQNLQAIGSARYLAAQKVPYLTNTLLGYDHTTRNAGSALLAAMVVCHEGNDLAFNRITDENVRASRDTLTAARTALEEARRNEGANQNQQMPGLQEAFTAAKRTHEENEYRLLIRNNLISRTATMVYIDVVGCFQVRALNDGNIANYFIMTGIPESDVPEDLSLYAAYWARSNSGIANIPIFQTRITEIEWVYYHTNASQNGPLVLQAAMSLPNSTNGSRFFTDAEMAAAYTHANDTKSMTKARAIPKTALIKAYAILDASSSLPEKRWYMGEKAKEMYPATQYQMIVSGLKQYNLAVKAKLLPADEANPGVIANNINALVANMNDTNLGALQVAVRLQDNGQNDPEGGEQDDDDNNDGNGGGNDDDDGNNNNDGDGGGNDDDDDDGNVNPNGWPDDGVDEWQDEGGDGEDGEEEEVDDDGDDDDDNDNDGGVGVTDEGTRFAMDRTGSGVEARSADSSAEPGEVPRGARKRPAEPEPTRRSTRTKG